jgi:hypothetical protein
MMNQQMAVGLIFFEEQKLTAFKNYQLQLLLETAIDAAPI